MVVFQASSEWVAAAELTALAAAPPESAALPAA
jgi:hypothetical protein